MDGGLMHFAQSIGTPVFIVFGCTSPKYRIHDWGKATCVHLTETELNCSGCHHKRPYPRTFTECDKDKVYCLENIGVDRLIKTYEENFL
jgi:ADP-heptose:LPS heptosyltransferase